ncbi:MAG TPA: translation elongation factor Ts [Candidatus Stercoripulliclostridium merdipullorum]|uniref:Elongation factor Ts n=1 Tax=Candidatus Stercoripulliclostridium merdipullorum TaxID=2840952 RepID=A0A9D1NCQ0_9FIRM|nr:translation elongation factor Ts [Candidatus Stercoripulliclostridium merdipullorum]
MAFTAKDVQELRAITGAGMMDCKKALTETDGNMEKAIEKLREKGMATAAKKAGRIASQGIVDSYIHMGGKIGVLLEVNCETDFVARSDAFKDFVHDVALQIAAAKPSYVVIDEVPAAELEKEKEIFRAQALNDPKPRPAAIIEKMVEGRIQKFYKEVCLMEQDFVKDPGKTITQYLNETIGTIGEKISIRRFVRYEMGEGLKKKEENFAEEISAQVAKAQANANK